MFTYKVWLTEVVLKWLTPQLVGTSTITYNPSPYRGVRALGVCKSATSGRPTRIF